MLVNEIEKKIIISNRKYLYSGADSELLTCPLVVLLVGIALLGKIQVSCLGRRYVQVACAIHDNDSISDLNI